MLWTDYLGALTLKIRDDAAEDQFAVDFAAQYASYDAVSSVLSVLATAGSVWHTVFREGQPMPTPWECGVLLVGLLLFAAPLAPCLGLSKQQYSASRRHWMPWLQLGRSALHLLDSIVSRGAANSYGYNKLMAKDIVLVGTTVVPLLFPLQLHQHLPLQLLVLAVTAKLAFSNSYGLCAALSAQDDVDMFSSPGPSPAAAAAFSSSCVPYSGPGHALGWQCPGLSAASHAGGGMAERVHPPAASGCAAINASGQLKWVACTLSWAASTLLVGSGQQLPMPAHSCPAVLMFCAMMASSVVTVLLYLAELQQRYAFARQRAHVTLLPSLGAAQYHVVLHAGAALGLLWAVLWVLLVLPPS